MRKGKGEREKGELCAIARAGGYIEVGSYRESELRWLIRLIRPCIRPPDVALFPNHHSYQTGVWLGVWSLHMLSLTSELPARHHALTTVTVVVLVPSRCLPL